MQKDAPYLVNLWWAETIKADLYMYDAMTRIQ